MGKVIFDISMSLDVFLTASNVRPEEPMGDGGQRLHEWAFGDDERNRSSLTEGVKSTGAVIAGRRTYDTSVPWWGADGPISPARLPVFVVTHNVPEMITEGGVYLFITDGIERALREAKRAGGDKDVTVMGGADIGGSTSGQDWWSSSRFTSCLCCSRAARVFSNTSKASISSSRSLR
jgi:dihydrofolate reductase